LIVPYPHSGWKKMAMKLPDKQRDMLHEGYTGMGAGFEQRLPE